MSRPIVGQSNSTNVILLGKNLEQLHQWLENPAPAQAWAAIYESACPGTGQWLLAHQKYLEWRDGPQSLIWCYGDRKLLEPFPSSVHPDVGSWRWQDCYSVSSHARQTLARLTSKVLW